MNSIYVIDDEPMIGIGLQAMIQEYGQFDRVAAFTDSTKAFAAIVSDTPDIVITDIRMPRMDGLELCQMIQSRKLATHIVVLSGYGDFSYAQKCMSFGVKEYLLKPVTEIELFPVLDRLLNEKNKGAFSYSRFEQWLDQLEESVWLTDSVRIEELLDQGAGEFFEALVGGQSVYQTAEDGLKLLVKKLNARKVYAFETVWDRSAATLGTEREAFVSFRAQISAWMEQLVVYRRGDQINFLEAAILYMDTHMCEDLTLETVAERMGLTPTYFSHYFKKMTNETFVQYRLRKRLERAKELLAVPHYKVIDIGAQVGYESYPHFSRIFKKATGYSPTEYRSTLGIK